jgi:outer membrane protein
VTCHLLQSFASFTVMRKVVVFLISAPLWGQAPLSLHDAVRTALRGNPAMTAASESSRAAEARVQEARGGRMPKVNYTESFTRSNNPVFVFSSLLTQHQFGEQNFAIGPLNRPAFLNNFQSLVSVNQTLYDGGQTREAIKSAELGRELTCEDGRRTEMELIAGVARAYYGVVLAAESLKTAEQAVRSAEADLHRADTVRAAGMSTDADVLSIRVHLAGVNEQRIRRAADLDVARAALNDAIGEPLDTRHGLTTALVPVAIPDETLGGLEQDATQARPEIRETHLAASLAETQVQAARAGMRPQVGVVTQFEADRQKFVTEGGANWLAAVTVRWNLFNGFSDKARVVEASHAVRRAEADVRRADSGVRLQVRRAYADLRSAQQRIEVAQASVAEAEESLRITQNRYEAGMSTVTDLLRTETAVLESRTRYLAAVHDQRVAATMLQLATGRLNADSEVLN